MKNIVKSVLSTAFMLCLTITAMSQINLRGSIVDANTNESLPGASVIIPGTSQGTVAGFDGTFRFTVPTGTKSIIVSFVGFISKELIVTKNHDLGIIALNSDAVGIKEISVMASVAVDRHTPVAVSSISPMLIAEKLGNQEFPEMLKSTPGVYATKGGGGFGDSRINLRGFESNNIGVMINGVPINDMESGKVYWSNWAGLSDVTRSQQVQRGLGASKVAIPSIGGTINILTKSTDSKKGGNFSYGIGNDGMEKQSLTLSTGLMDNGWAVTFSGSHTKGDGWVKSTDFEGWSYFLSIAKQINDNHRLSFTAFGAPQTHNQRSTRATIGAYNDHRDGRRMNLDYGYMNGEKYNAKYNFYHKPQISLNHYWTISDKTFLSTSAYMSVSQGGGRSTAGSNKNWLRYNANGTKSSSTKVTSDGFLDFDSVLAENAASNSGSKAIMTNSINAHEWYGLLSTLSTDLSDELKFTGGIDARYYIGKHYQEVENLLGGEYYLEGKKKDREVTQRLRKGDKVGYHNEGLVAWGGLFSQLEYSKNNLSAFVSAAVSTTQYQRIDYFQYKKPDQKSDWQKFVGYSVKGGANYNIDENHNVFANLGYFERSPFFKNVFLNYKNDVNEDPANERVYSAEVGYGYRAGNLAINVNGYYTKWLDKSFAKTVRGANGDDYRFNVLGIDALHMGLEMDVKYKVSEKLNLTGMFSTGDWTWDSNATATGFNMDEVNSTEVEYLDIYAKGLKVGDAAQTTAALGLDYQVFDDIKIGVNYNYYANLYSYFNITDRTNEADTQQAWKMPDYGLVDFNVKYTFELAGLKSTLYANVNNLFDTEYMSDATDGAGHDWRTSYGFYGFGRTASMRLKIKF